MADGASDETIETEAAPSGTHQSGDSAAADVTAEEVAATRASDAEVAAENDRLARQAERADVQTASPAPPAINPMQGFRPPPIPDDSADGTIHIRFKHPE
jgi:hypothetical protein